MANAAVGFDERTLAPTYELRMGVPGASAGINIAQQLGLNTQIVSSARERLSSQTQDISRFLDRLHSQLRDIDSEKSRLGAREQEIARKLSHLETEGKKEQRDKVRELEKKLESVLHSFEYQARETVAAVQDRAQALKLTKDAERRIAKLRREFREQFDSTVVAHTTGSDAGDQHAQPHIVTECFDRRHCAPALARPRRQGAPSSRRRLFRSRGRPHEDESPAR